MGPSHVRSGGLNVVATLLKKTEANEIDAKLKQKSSSRTHTLHYRALITNIYKLQTVINLCSQDMNRFNVFTYS